MAVTFGNKAMTMPQDSEKVGAASIDLIQTNVERLSVYGIGLGNTPAKIDVDQLHVYGPASFFQFAKHHANQMIALLVHIPKSRRNENPYRLPTCCH